jgi:hypothetical protein
LKKYKREMKSAKKEKKETSVKPSDPPDKREWSLPSDSNEGRDEIDYELSEQESILSVTDDLSDSRASD